MDLLSCIYTTHTMLAEWICGTNIILVTNWFYLELEENCVKEMKEIEHSGGSGFELSH